MARDGPIDQYIMSHPDFIFGKPHEHAFIKHDNPYVLMDHIRCAAAELPLTGDDAALFGEDLGGIAEILADEGELAERDGRWYWRKAVSPAHEVRLRGVMSDSSYTVQDLDTNKVIASEDEWAAYNLLHPGAVYMLDGETYLVEELDITTRIAYVRKRRVGYFTLPSVRDRGFPVDGDSQERTWRGCALWLGDIGVALRVVGFEKRTFWRHECIGGGALDLPELRMETVGLDIRLPETTTARVEGAGLDYGSGWVGVSNALLSVLPGFVMCEDSDVAASWQDKVPPFYDRYPGGLGYVEKLYHIIEDVWQAAYELVRDCPCQNGCPACVGSLPARWELPAEYTDMGRPFAPGMEIHMTGKIADKQSALFILRDVLAHLFPP